MSRFCRHSIVVTAVALVSCASGIQSAEPWIRFSYAGMWGIAPTFHATISHSGVLEVTTHKFASADESYTGYLSRDEMLRIENLVTIVGQKYGPEINFVLVEDDYEYRIAVTDTQGRVMLRTAMDSTRACSDAPSAQAAAQLWNTILRTIESPGLRTSESLITCEQEPSLAGPTRR